MPAAMRRRQPAASVAANELGVANANTLTLPRVVGAWAGAVHLPEQYACRSSALAGAARLHPAPPDPLGPDRWHVCQGDAHAPHPCTCTRDGIQRARAQRMPSFLKHSTRHVLALAWTVCLAPSLIAQSPASTRNDVSAKASCMLRSFEAEGFRVQAVPSDSTRRRLVRLLTGVNEAGRLAADDSRTQMVEVTLDVPVPGLTVQGTSMLWPGRQATASQAAEERRLSAAVRTLWQESAVRCSP